MNGNRIPTVNDLRVKLCYICREEEHFDAAPESPPRPWTHPCKCTLIAHETCLLKWIQTSQSDSRRATNALKCPQCGADYEIISRKGRLLRWIGAANRALQKAGRVFTVGTALGCAFIFGTGIYLVLTGYGAYAVRQFIGKEMYDILLTDDPANWPWTAYINLPSLTLSLILSRLQSRSATPHIPMLVPLLLVWPHAKPVGQRSRVLDEYWQRPENVRDLASSWPGSSPDIDTAIAHTKTVLDRWPPSPVIFGLFVVPIVRAVYKRCFGRVQTWVLGAQPPSAGREGGAGWEWRLGEPFMIRIRMEGEVQQGAFQGPGQGGGGAGGGEEQRVRVENAEVQEEQRGQGQQPPEEAVPNEAAVAAAEQLIEVDTSSLGRRIGGALLIPSISSSMGSLLLQLSKRSYWLKRFLAVRGGGPVAGGLGVGEGTRRFLPPLFGMWSHPKNWEGTGWARQMGLGMRLVLGATWNGTRTWAEADPVWWRNAVGLGLFIVAKDCVQLLHLWLAKRELESRHVKSRDFAGVDIKELDLVPSFPHGM